MTLTRKHFLILAAAGAITARLTGRSIRVPVPEQTRLFFLSEHEKRGKRDDDSVLLIEVKCEKDGDFHLPTTKPDIGDSRTDAIQKSTDTKKSAARNRWPSNHSAIPDHTSWMHRSYLVNSLSQQVKRVAKTDTSRNKLVSAETARFDRIRCAHWSSDWCWNVGWWRQCWWCV